MLPGNAVNAPSSQQIAKTHAKTITLYNVKKQMPIIYSDVANATPRTSNRVENLFVCQ